MPVKIYTKPINANADGKRERIIEVPHLDYTYGERLNRPGSISFTVSTEHPDVVPSKIAAKRHEVEVVENGQVVWEGVLLTAQERGKTMTFSGEGLMARLREGVLSEDFGTFTGSTVLDSTAHAAWEVVERWQGEDNPYNAQIENAHNVKPGWGLTVDWSRYDPPSPVAVPLGWEPHDTPTIYEVVQTLIEGETSGEDEGERFDISIEPGRVFTPHYPQKGRVRADIVIDDRCVRSWSRDIDGTQQASGLFARTRPETTQDTPITESHIDLETAAEFGLTVSELSELDRSQVSGEQISAVLEHRKEPPTVLSVVITESGGPNPRSYEIGDTIRLVIPSKYREVRTTRRLIGRDFTRQGGDRLITLHFDDAGGTQ